MSENFKPRFAQMQPHELSKFGIDTTPNEEQSQIVNMSTNGHTNLREGFELSILDDSNQMRFGEPENGSSSE